jgi:4-hydroxy-3-methylbut-2-enyl diphosphate reductase
MKITIVRSAGFCFGVKRAVEIAFDIAAKRGGRVVTFGPIIHNPQVIERLRSEGVDHVEDVEAVLARNASAVIVRTHGIPEETIGRLRETGAEVIDATCPFVKKAQQYAKLLSDEKYQVIILGDREHPEVKGLMSYAGPDAIVIAEGGAIPRLRSRVGIVVQTTQQMANLSALVAGVVGRVKEMKVYNTICNSTADRLGETESLAREVDVMIIVGGRNSANTSQLAALTASMNIPSYHIETAGELRPEWFSGARHVGITAGASTPDWIIDEVKDRITVFGGRSADGNAE